MSDITRLRSFVQELTTLVSREYDEASVLEHARPLLHALITHDDWLPEAFARPHADGYRQYLLYCDPLERFSVVSFVWGPGQRTPVHDHTVWGLVGVMRGQERCEEYQHDGAGRAMRKTGEHLVAPGEIDAVSPSIGDVHVVSNALTERASVSIHVYGANIGAVRRHVYDPATGEMRLFVSGYHNEVTPNLWDRSAQVMAAR